MRGALVVVESPAKARTINKILGKDFKVMASMGHVRDLPKKELGIDVANGFKPTYRTIRDRNKFVTELRAASRSAGRLILATDPDREGEAIAWHVAEALKRVNDAQRVMFNEITERAVREAVANPSEIDLRKVDAQQARRVLDRLVGYKVSPLLWKTVHGGLSAGRVQSVALRLICEREAAIEAFVPEEYWTVDAKVKREDTLPFRARLVRLKGEKLALKDREEVDRILLDLRAAASDPGYRIADVKRQVQRRNPAPPFITSTLQQEASRRLRFTARKTMQVAQQLYEGIEVRSGTQSATETTGLITYMRTDSTRIASDAVSSARDYIRQRFGEAYLPVRARSYRKGKGAQDAHEAIRPTDMQRPPEVVQAQLTADQSKLYRLIWDRFIACQMSSAVFNRTAVDIRAGEYELRATGSVLKFAGFNGAICGGQGRRSRGGRGASPGWLEEGRCPDDDVTASRAALHEAAREILRGHPSQGAGVTRNRTTQYIRSDYQHAPGPGLHGKKERTVRADGSGAYRKRNSGPGVSRCFQCGFHREDGRRARPGGKRRSRLGEGGGRLLWTVCHGSAKSGRAAQGT